MQPKLQQWLHINIQLFDQNNPSDNSVANRYWTWKIICWL